jgi:signal transduction histidine kinase
MPADQTPSDGSPTPAWIRRPGILHALAYAVAALVFAGQMAAVLARGADLPTIVAVLIAGVGVALSWRLPWVGLVVTSAATFGVTAVGRDPLSVWMMGVLVLFSVALRGRHAVAATAVVAIAFVAALMTVGGFRGGAVAGCAALFSAIAGGAAGSALGLYRRHWLVLDDQARRAVAARESETTRRVVEERLRIARDLHDVVGHQVAMLSVHLGVAEIGLPPDAESSRQALVSARTSARTVVVETQAILALLRRGDVPGADEALRPTPSLDALDALIASFESIGLTVAARIERPVPFVPPGVGVAVYRLVQEALTNAYRHGGGSATVELTGVDGAVRVVVENAVSRSARDTGAGGGGGLGLVGMRERVEAAGGTLDVDTVDGRFRVRAELAPSGAVVA